MKMSDEGDAWIHFSPVAHAQLKDLRELVGMEPTAENTCRVIIVACELLDFCVTLRNAGGEVYAKTPDSDEYVPIKIGT